MLEYPHNREAERAVIGGIILDPRWFHEVSANLRDGDFYLPGNRAIFSAIRSLVESDSPVDAVLIYAELQRAGTEKHIGNVAYISQLTDDCIPSHSVRYAKEVHDLARRRAMIVAGVQIQHSGLSGKGSVEDYMSESRTAVVSISDEKTDQRARLLSETIESAVLESTSDCESEYAVKTGLDIIDGYYGALYPRVLTVLAARPGMGKSTFLLNVATNAALSGKHVYFMSLEDDRYFIQCRLLARFSDVDSLKIIRRRLADSEKDAVRQKKDLVGCLPITIDDGGPFTSEQVCRRVVAHCVRNPCDLVVIDHLGHVADTGKSEYEIATKAVKVISDLPKQCNVPVLLASQLNREVEKRVEKEPTLSDLRNSGEIEQRARAVWMLSRPHYYDNTKDPNELVFIVAKANHGITGKAKLWIDLPKMTVLDRSMPRSSDY